MSTNTIERRTAIVTIYGGDYLSRIRHLEQLAKAAQEAEAPGPRTLDDAVPEYLTIAQEHDALVREAEAQATHIKVQALPRRHWKAVCAKHPPRTVAADGVTERIAMADAAVGVNEETFKDALVFGETVLINGQEILVKSIVEPVGLSDEDIENLSDADFDRVYFTAFSLNRGMTADPKASLASQMTPKTEETSS